MRILLALLLLAGSAHAAPAFGVVLTNDSTKIRIELADLPGSKDLFVVNRTCSARVSPQIQWGDFTKASKIVLAKQAVAIFEALESLCGDKDYRAAVQVLTAVRVELRADAAGLELKTGGGTLTVTFSDTSFNPRESARRWLENHL